MKKFAAFLFCGFAASVLAGCATAKINYVKDGFSAPDIVAMLPADNQSNDLTAPRAALGAVASALIGANYFPISTPAQEEILRKLGLTDGGQLNAFKLTDLASKLETDGLVVTRIDEFKKVNIGIYISPTVETTVMLYDNHGEKLWEATSKFTEKKFNLSLQAAIQAGAQELAGDLVGKIFKTSLVRESQIMGGLLAKKMTMNKPSLAYPGPAYQPATPKQVAAK
ncbi:MAG: DUF799 family lipoprotein [Elusimicrobia bacterium]|nr:DUF799 family lipoprotein [Elusimicrobiota bacterium]